MAIYMGNLIQNYGKRFFLKIEKKSRKKLPVLDIFTISPLQRLRGISQNASGLNYVRRGTSYIRSTCVLTLLFRESESVFLRSYRFRPQHNKTFVQDSLFHIVISLSLAARYLARFRVTSQAWGKL